MLELATLAELVTEISKRYPSVVVIVSKELSKNSEETFIHYRGNINAALGLCVHGQQWLAKDIVFSPMDIGSDIGGKDED